MSSNSYIDLEQELLQFIKILKTRIYIEYDLIDEPNYEKITSEVFERLNNLLKSFCNSAEIAIKTNLFCEKLPSIIEIIKTDIEALLDGDPAATSILEILLCYPGFKAIWIYRMAHELFLQDIPIIPRALTEYAHTQTGIDIHPGATIGHHFFIDHGTGIVIGETTIIGNYVKIYHGVTLGALSLQKGKLLKGKKRHPTIGDNVVIYACASVFGGETIIGSNSIIGSNVTITTSVKNESKIFLKCQI